MTIHRHDFPGIGHNQPCALCAADDREALIDALAIALWEHRPGEAIDPTDWDLAGPHWQMAFREYARAAINLLKPER